MEAGGVTSRRRKLSSAGKVGGGGEQEMEAGGVTSRRRKLSSAGKVGGGVWELEVGGLSHAEYRNWASPPSVVLELTLSLFFYGISVFINYILAVISVLCCGILLG